MNTRVNHRSSPKNAIARERIEATSDVDGWEIVGFIELSAMSPTITACPAKLNTLTYDADFSAIFSAFDQKQQKHRKTTFSFGSFAVVGQSRACDKRGLSRYWSSVTHGYYLFSLQEVLTGGTHQRACCRGVSGNVSTLRFRPPHLS
jgi:hypothetical protein